MRGGRREGAGRPKGSLNKANAKREADVKASGLTPLDYMLGILRDDTADAAQRFEAAKAAAPYVHPRLSATELKGDLTINDVSAEPASEAEWSAQHHGNA